MLAASNEGQRPHDASFSIESTLLQPSQGSSGVQLSLSQEATRLPWEMPSSQTIAQEFVDLSTSKDKEKAWAETADKVKRYSDDVIAEWNTEIDYFLVYSGIFSGILTSFVISTYPNLQSSSSDLAVSLQEFVREFRTQCARVPYADNLSQFAEADSSSLPHSVVATNVLLFCSLLCGLAATFFGLMVKQWLHDYRTVSKGTAKHIARLRWFRINNTIKWRVAHIISSLFILLQISLVLFFAGLLVLLWNIHRPLAIVMSSLIGIVGILLVIATILPVIHSTCCYLSPITYSLFNLLYRTRYVLQRGVLRLLSKAQRGMPPEEWLDEKHKRLEESRAGSTWHGREAKSIMRTSEALDRDLVTATVLGHLAKNAKQATSDSVNEVVLHLMADLGPQMASECLSSVYKAMVDEFRTDSRAKDTGPYLASTIPLDFWIAALPKMIPYISYGQEVLYLDEKQGGSQPQNALVGRLLTDGLSNIEALGRSVLRKVQPGINASAEEDPERVDSKQGHAVKSGDHAQNMSQQAVPELTAVGRPKVEQLVDQTLLRTLEKQVTVALRYIDHGIRFRGSERNPSRDRRLLLVLSWCAYTIGGDSRDYSIYLLHLLLCRSRDKERKENYPWRLIQYLVVTMEQRFVELRVLLTRGGFEQTQPRSIEDLTASQAEPLQIDVLAAKILKVSEIIIFCCMKQPDFWEGDKPFEDAVASREFAERVLRFLSGLVAPGKLLSPSADMAKLEYVADMLASMVDVLAESQDGKELYTDVLDNKDEVVRTWIRQARVKIPMVFTSREAIAANISVGRLADAMDRITRGVDDDVPTAAALDAIRTKSASEAAGRG